MRPIPRNGHSPTPFFYVLRFYARCRYTVFSFLLPILSPSFIIALFSPNIFFLISHTTFRVIFQLASRSIIKIDFITRVSPFVPFVYHRAATGNRLKSRLKYRIVIVS